MTAPFVWFDLAADSPDQAATFYADLLGWPAAPAADAGDCSHWLLSDDRPWAGIVGTDAARSGRWVPFVRVEDLDAASARAVELGASLVRERTAGPAGDSVVVADPAGAHVALWQPTA